MFIFFAVAIKCIIVINRHCIKQETCSWYYYSHEVDQAQKAHSSEVSLGVIPLESDVSPLFGYPGLQFDCWHQKVPQLKKQTKQKHDQHDHAPTSWIHIQNLIC